MGAHSYHLLSSPSIPGKEDKGGNFSQRWEQSVPHSGPTEVSSGSHIWPQHIRKQYRHPAAGTSDTLLRLQVVSPAQQLQAGLSEACRLLSAVNRHQLDTGFSSIPQTSLLPTAVSGPLQSFLFPPSPFRHWSLQVGSKLISQTRYLQLHGQVQVIWAFISVFQGNNIFMLNPEKNRHMKQQVQLDRKLFQDRQNCSKTLQNIIQTEQKHFEVHNLIPKLFPDPFPNSPSLISSPLPS